MFASQITSGVAVPFSDNRSGSSKDARNSLYVLLRRYRGLQTQGFGVKGKAVSYEPFKLVLSFREAPDEARSDKSVGLTPIATSMLLVINASPVQSVYKGKKNTFTVENQIQLTNAHFIYEKDIY